MHNSGRSLAVIVLFVLTAACGAQNQLMAAHEASATGAIRIIQQAQVQYYSQFGKYASTLAELGPPASGAASSAAADLIPKDLATGNRDGYVFVMTAKPKGFTINANPEQFNSTGRRTFYSDESLTLRANSGPEPATAASPELK
jgi:type IV pilus assembly protein PilA